MPFPAQLTVIAEFFGTLDDKPLGRLKPHSIGVVEEEEEDDGAAWTDFIVGICPMEYNRYIDHSCTDHPESVITDDVEKQFFKLIIKTLHFTKQGEFNATSSATVVPPYVDYRGRTSCEKCLKERNED
uniref:SET domain-containing protein n=1 Tax=Ascaris lumbricoides TaxID=6252 RepID=A0A0M3I518_ASCLU